MQQQDKTDWLPISDLMSGLMMIFMLIVILLSYQKAKQEEDYTAQCTQIYNALYDAFEQYIEDGNVDLRHDLTIRFSSNRNKIGIPDVLFDNAESNLTPYFKNMLQQFYPTYIKVLRQQHESDNPIQSLRIEGHTSSKWGNKSGQEAYFKNMKLSQDRARVVYQFVLETDIDDNNRTWATQRTTANGLSSNKLLNQDGYSLKQYEGVEDGDKSRRVEFKAIATACQLAGVNEDA